MSYEAQDKLSYDAVFQGRVRSCCTQQANMFKDDQDPALKATAHGILRSEVELQAAFINMSAAAPGFAEKVEQPNGEIDQSQIVDQEILSVVQAIWPTVASLYFNADGTPIEG